MFVLDTNVVVEFLRGRLPNTYDTLRRSDPRLFCVPAIVEAELRSGAMRARNPKRELARVSQFLAPLDILPFDSRCAGRYARISAYLSSRGCKIGANDLLIAATALTYDATLVTRNEREFMRVPGLLVEVWDEIAPVPEIDEG